MHIPCPHCLTTNRVPPERLAEGPLCGACKQALLPSAPVVLDGSNFDALSRSELPLVVDFWAAWCGPCRSMAPQFAQAAANLQGQALFGKLDTDGEAALASRFAIRSIPTLLILRQGREVARQAGARPAAEIERWVRQTI